MGEKGRERETYRDKSSDQSFEEIREERIVFVKTLSYSGPVPTETELLFEPCEDYWRTLRMRSVLLAK